MLPEKLLKQNKKITIHGFKVQRLEGLRFGDSMFTENLSAVTPAQIGLNL